LSRYERIGALGILGEAAVHGVLSIKHNLYRRESWGVEIGGIDIHPPRSVARSDAIRFEAQRFRGKPTRVSFKEGFVAIGPKRTPWAMRSERITTFRLADSRSHHGAKFECSTDLDSRNFYL